MSRIDEAQRRAGEHSGKPESLAVDTVDLIDAAAAEPFPVELSAARAAQKGQARSPLASAPAPAAVAQIQYQPQAREGVPPKLIEMISEGLSRKVVSDSDMLPVSREQYRRLAASLHHAQEDTGIKVLMITSAVPGEGKTLTAANLALTFSESYLRSVLVIDADLRRPSQHSVFKLDNSSGLSEGLYAISERPMKVRRVSDNLSVLPAGRATSDPMAGLTSSRMQRLLAQAREMFDWVIIDTSPVGLLPDANLLTTFADAVVMVVRAGETPYPVVQKAMAAVGKEKLLGVVLNRAERGASVSEYDYYYDAYQPRAGGSQP